MTADRTAHHDHESRGGRWRIAPLRAAALPAALVLALAGCGSGSGGASTASHAHDPSMGDMPGMDHAATTPTDQATTPVANDAPVSADDRMKMPGMVPLVSGADGTASSAGGRALIVGGVRFKAGKPGTLRLLVTKFNGQRVTSFQRDQTKLMHLIVVRNDFTGYQHLHPSFTKRGSKFAVKLTLPKAGLYRAIADFTTGGKRYALRADLTATGPRAKRAKLPPVSHTAKVDGYEVQLADGRLTAGREASLRFTIAKDGQPETALQPYLGAEGHLVALRDPDLAYSHVHPVSSHRAAGSITFNADFPTAAKYRLYLQFRASDAVHTAEFTVDVGS